MKEKSYLLLNSMKIKDFDLSFYLLQICRFQRFASYLSISTEVLKREAKEQQILDGIVIIQLLFQN